MGVGLGVGCGQAEKCEEKKKTLIAADIDSDNTIPRTSDIHGDIQTDALLCGQQRDRCDTHRH